MSMTEKDKGKIAEKCWLIIKTNTNPDKNFVRATREQDVNEHWDFLYHGKRVDVKNNFFYDYRKRLCVVVELWNCYGNDGSLFGKADDLAFQISGDSSVNDLDNIAFVQIDRLKLIEYHKKLTSTELMSDMKYSTNKLYRSKNKSDRGYKNNDILTAIPVDDIINLGCEIIKLNR